jgi:diacylglycerol kinase (ATP)
MKKQASSERQHELSRMQEKHKRLLEKVEKSAGRLERRRRNLVALETEIAKLEQQSAPKSKAPAKQRAPRAKDLKRVRLIFNPTAGRDEKQNDTRLKQLVASLRAHGIEADVALKTSGKVARKLARQAAKDGDPLVIVAGGDGTLQDVAGQLVGSSTVLGIIPTGTMNNVARSLGIPLEIDDACALIGMGTARHIDLGQVVSADDAKDQYFVNCAGVGVSAIAAKGGQAVAKGRWNLVPGALRKFFETRPGPMRVELDGKVINASTQMVIVSNAPLVGNQLLAMPDAKMDDGLLDVQLYEGMSDVALMKHFKKAAEGSPQPMETYHVRHIRIIASEPLPANSDAAVLPEQHVIEMKVVPGAVSVIVGNGTALSVPVESAPSAPMFAEDPPVTADKS